MYEPCLVRAILPAEWAYSICKCDLGEEETMPSRFCGITLIYIAHFIILASPSFEVRIFFLQVFATKTSLVQVVDDITSTMLLSM